MFKDKLLSSVLLLSLSLSVSFKKHNFIPVSNERRAEKFGQPTDAR